MLIALILSATIQIGYHETAQAVPDYAIRYDYLAGNYFIEIEEGNRVSLTGAILLNCLTESGWYYGWKVRSNHPGKPKVVILGMDPDDVRKGDTIEVSGEGLPTLYYRVVTLFQAGKFQMVQYDPK